MNDTKTQPTGIYDDRLRRSDGTSVEFGWRPNLIVEQCRELLAAFMMGDTASGVQFLALGRGDITWDATPPQPPSPGAQALFDSTPVELAVGSPQMTLQYLNVAGEPTAGPTSRMEIAATVEPGGFPLGPGETSFPLREFGLFGQFGSTNYMIDYVRHPVIHIGPDDTFTRRIRLSF